VVATLPRYSFSFYVQLSSNGNLNLDTSLDVDDDLLDDLSWRVKTTGISFSSIYYPKVALTQSNAYGCASRSNPRSSNLHHREFYGW